MKTNNCFISCLFIAFLALPVFSFGQDGSLDLTFGTAGTVTTSIVPANFEQAYGMTVQADGKIILVGVSGGDFAVARYNTDGSPDNTFDSDGKLTTSIGPGSDAAIGVTVQPDGKIVVVGGTIGVANDFAVLRYNADGSLDTSFDNDGIVVTDIDTKNDYAFAVALQADGKIVVAGHSAAAIGAKYNVAVARYNTNGSLDNTFDADGKAISNFGTDDSAHSLGLQSDGKIVVGGQSHDGTTLDLLVTRFNTDGSLDLTFDTDGRVTTTFAPSSFERGKSIVVQTDGKILLCGATTVSGNFDFALVRYNGNGSLDASFDGDGKLTTAFSALSDEGFGIAVLPNGKIVVAGTRINGSNTDICLARYNTDGSMDTSFDSDGKVITPGGTALEPAYTMALQSDGKILTGGGFNMANKNSFALRRFNNSLVAGISRLNINNPIIEIYPNPSNGKFNLLSEKPVLKLEIYDQIGKCVYTSTVPGTKYEINISALSKGVYICKISHESGQTTSGQIVIE
ncbi:MAG TPA: T9SS type A sorting domain-containing protein [Bacteroidia bacterium]|nr:T9SS type A sorting domain-containing protein [Bacteroidia bacterium]